MAATDNSLTECLKAIKVAWDAASSLSGIGGPHLHKKPPKAPHIYPYAVVKSDISVLDRWTCDSEFWDNGITILIYHTTPNLVDTNVNLIRAVFVPESLSLPLDVGSVIRKRIEESAIEELDENVYRGSVPISLYTTRPRVKS